MGLRRVRGIHVSTWDLKHVRVMMGSFGTIVLNHSLNFIWQIDYPLCYFNLQVIPAGDHTI